jgi:hypothetical protein
MLLLRLTRSAVSGDSGLVGYTVSNSFHPSSVSFHLVSTALDSTAFDFLVWMESLMSSQP